MTFVKARTPITNKLLPYLGLLLLVVASLAASWVGYVASDDAFYWTGGIGWLTHFPYVAEYFGTIRHPVVIPIAISIGIFGDNEFALSLSTMLYFAGIVLVSYHFSRRVFDDFTALLLSGILAITPLYSIQATIASADLPELFFIVLSLWLFVCSAESTHSATMLAASGAAAAGAWLTRETTLALLLFYGLLFLIGLYRPRRAYWLMAIGFGCVYAVELAYFWAMTGDPLYRIRMVLGASALADRSSVTNFGIDDSGNIRLNSIVDPLLVVAANQEFGILYYLVILAFAWALWPSGTPVRERSLSRLFVILGSVAFIFSAVALQNVKLLPRYYSTATYAFLVTTVVWIRYGIWPRHRYIAGLVIAAVVATDLLCIYVDNKDPRFAERRLAEYAASVSEPVYTDPETAFRADLFLHWKGATGKVVGMPPPPGSLYFYDPRNAAVATPRYRPEQFAAFHPRANWQPVAQMESPRKLSGRLLELLGLDRSLPREIYRRLDRPNPTITIYRVPTGG